MRVFYQDSLATLYHGDAREILPQLPKADLCLTDSPYGINIAAKQAGKQKHTKIQMLTGSWDRERVDPELIRLCLTAARHQIIWGGNYYADLLPLSRAWLVWYKRPGMKQIAFGDGELAWTSFKAPIRVKSYTWTGFLTSGERRYPHPTQKPVEVMRWCIGQMPGECRSIIDPFTGSGSILVAAKQLGISAIGIDLDERYLEIAAMRLAET